MPQRQRRAAAGVRPEDSLLPAAHYNATEAARYHSCSEVEEKQLQLTLRALDLLSNSSSSISGSRLAPGDLVADIGCGSGLSGAVLSQLGLPWLGLDVSGDMLQIAMQGGATLPQSSSGDGTGSGATAAADAGNGCSPPCLLLSDVGQGLPLRPTCLDGAISISAVQWLLVEQQQQHDSGAAAAPAPGHSSSNGQQEPAVSAAGNAAARRLACCLARCLKPGAGAVLQFYPRAAADAQAVTAATAAAGLSPLLLVDLPHFTVARKTFLLLRAPAQQGDLREAAAAAPACPLGWPIGGTCCLWWRRQQQPQQQEQQPSAAAAAAGSDYAQAWLWQQQQQQPGDAAGAAAGAAGVAPVLSCVDGWVSRCHQQHARKLLRLVWRAAANAGFLDAATAAAAAGPLSDSGLAAGGSSSKSSSEQVASDGEQCLKLLLQVELPQCTCSSSSNSSSSGGSTSQRETTLNCSGNTLLLLCAGRPSNLAAAGLLEPAEVQSLAGQAPTAAAADKAAAVAAGQQLAGRLLAALRRILPPPPQQQPCTAELLSAEFAAASDLQPQQQQQAPRQKSRPAKRKQPQPDDRQRDGLPAAAAAAAVGRVEGASGSNAAQPSLALRFLKGHGRQFVSAQLAPLQQPQQQQHAAAMATACGMQPQSCCSGLCRLLRDQQQQPAGTAAAGLAEEVAGSSSSSWWRLMTADTFPPHTVYRLTQQQAAGAGGSGSAAAVNVTSPPASVAAAEAVVAMLHRGLSSVAGPAGAWGGCLGVFGAVLVVGGGGWQLLLDQY